MPPGLEIRGLSKSFAGRQVLCELTLDVPRGLFGLLGPNGAGKTTLMSILATLLDADAGSVRFGAVDVLRDPATLRRRLGYLPQEFGLYPEYRTQALLEYFAALKGIARGDRRRQADDLLARVGLWNERRTPVGALSGGMRQRLGIAQALLGGPELLVVDEPTAGLDPEERIRFQDLLAEAAEGAVVLLSTHIVEDVVNVCERVAILCAGRVVRDGPPRDLMEGLRGFTHEGPATAVTPDQHLISTRRLAGGRVSRVWSPDTPPGFRPVEPGLEDVYRLALAEARA